MHFQLWCLLGDTHSRCSALILGMVFSRNCPLQLQCSQRLSGDLQKIASFVVAQWRLCSTYEWCQASNSAYGWCQDFKVQNRSSFITESHPGYGNACSLMLLSQHGLSSVILATQELWIHCYLREKCSYTVSCIWCKILRRQCNVFLMNEWITWSIEEWDLESVNRMMSKWVNGLTWRWFTMCSKLQ